MYSGSVGRISEDDTKMLGGCALVILGIAYVPFFAVLTIMTYGLVFSQLWAWFVVPIFGLPTLSVPAAYGLASILSLTSPTVKSPKNEDYELWPAWKKIGTPVVELLTRPLIVLAVGWVLHFMI